MVNNALGHRLGQIHSVESQRDDEDRVCLGSQWQPHGVYAPSTLRRGEASTARILRGKKVPTKTGGSTSRKLTKSSSHASMLPTANVRDNMHEWGPWRCYSWGVCTTDGNYDGCDARNLCCNSHAVRSFFNNAIDSVKQPLRGKFQAARHKTRPWCYWASRLPARLATRSRATLAQTSEHDQRVQRSLRRPQ